MSLQDCSGVKEVVSAGPVWVAAGQEAEIRAVLAGQVPPVQGVLSAMWNFKSIFDFDLRIHSCLLHHPASYYTSHPSLYFVFEPCCHFSYPNPPQENMAPQQRHPGRTPRTLTRNFLSSSRNSPLTSIQSSRSRHRHSARARHSPLSGSTTRDRETPLRLPRFQQHSLYRCSEKHLNGSPLLETPDNSDFDVRGSAQVMEDETSHQFRRSLFPYSDTPASKPNRPHYTSPSNEGTAAMDTELVVKKSASKRRLKRL